MPGNAGGLRLPWRPRTVRGRPDGTAQRVSNPLRPSGSSSETSTRSHARVAGVLAHELDHRLDRVRLALEHGLGAAVGAVLRPARHAAAARLAAHGVAEEHALDGALLRGPGGGPWLQGTVQGVAAIEALDTDITALEVGRDRQRGQHAAAARRGCGRGDPARRRPGDPARVRRAGADRPRRGRRDLGRRHALPLGDPRRDDGARRPDVGRDHPPRDRIHARQGRRARRAQPGAGGVRHRRRRLPGREAARIEVEEVRRHLEGGSELERVVFAVHGDARCRRSRPRWPSDGRRVRRAGGRGRRRGRDGRAAASTAGLRALLDAALRHGARRARQAALRLRRPRRGGHRAARGHAARRDAGARRAARRSRGGGRPRVAAGRRHRRRAGRARGARRSGQRRASSA